jgi:hypothetical protein
VKYKTLEVIELSLFLQLPSSTLTQLRRIIFLLNTLSLRVGPYVDAYLKVEEAAFKFRGE